MVVVISPLSSCLSHLFLTRGDMLNEYGKNRLTSEEKKRRLPSPNRNSGGSTLSRIQRSVYVFLDSQRESLRSFEKEHIPSYTSLPLQLPKTTDSHFTLIPLTVTPLVILVRDKDCHEKNTRSRRNGTMERQEDSQEETEKDLEELGRKEGTQDGETEKKKSDLFFEQDERIGQNSKNGHF